MKNDYDDFRPTEQGPTQSEYKPAYARGLNPLNANALLSKKFPPTELVLSPFLPSQGLCMIHGPRGIGKTHIAMGIACAVASGGTFLDRFHAPKPRSVLFIDGEMPGSLLQERLARAVDNLGREVPADNLQFVAADLEKDGLPDLADPGSQAYLDAVVAPADLVIIDNLSTVCRSMRENDADTWGPVQSWLLKLRWVGKSVLLIHHSGKSGGQRGTSRKEDVLNSVIGLKRPPGYSAEQGARFEVHYEKARSFCGADAEPFEAWLKPDGCWTVGPIQKTDDDIDTFRALQDEGHSVREISKRTGVSKSTVSRRLKEGES